MQKEVKLGSDTQLKCNWKLSGNNMLYSVKWYKDDYEFFSYVPGEKITYNYFPRNGITLDVSLILFYLIFMRLDLCLL